MSGPSTEAEDEQRVPSPCRAKTKRRPKDEKKVKDLERLLTELLYESGYSHKNNIHFEQEDGIDHDEDLFPELEDLEEILYPWELDFCDWKNGIYRRRGNLLHRNCRVSHSRKYSRRNSYLATLDKVNYVESENKKNLICYENKKLRGSKVHLLKRDLRKVAKKTTELELKKNNIEKRLLVKKTPRRGPVKPNAPTSIQPIWPTKTRGNAYDKNQFVLRNDNADKLGSEDFMLTLISLQEREITPEDFDLLLQLDSFVEVKTVPKTIIDQMRTEQVENEMGNPCMICMEEYEIGETVKYLNCGHFFHSSCIRTWLTVNSDKCPLDGQEVR